jgi:SAM-dependent methyltransferase
MWFRRLLKRLHAPIYASRLETLVPLVLQHVRPGDLVLDVGCGFGELGQAVLRSPTCPADVLVRGLEIDPGETGLIPVDRYDGLKIPYPDRSFDIVILADVLHHAVDPDLLLDECVRIARRNVLIKDHKLDGPLAQYRVAFIDWAANWPYQRRCSFEYNTLERWHRLIQRSGLSVAREEASLAIYPPMVNFFFGGRLHYWVAARVSSDGGDTHLRTVR